MDEKKLNDGRQEDNGVEHKESKRLDEYLADKPNPSKEGYQESPTSEKDLPLSLNFKGKAKIVEDQQVKDSIKKEFIPELNSRSAFIAEQIKNDIQSKLPAGMEIKVDIDFRSGSIEFFGFVTILLSAIGHIVSVADFLKLAKDATKFSVEKNVGRQIEEKYTIEEIDTDVYERKESRFRRFRNRISRFLWWCSGSTMDILSGSPTEKTKYEGIGGAVLTTWVLATLSGGYAAYTIFEDSALSIGIALILGVIWGLIIFNIDRYIVSTLKKERERSLWNELFRAVPRLLLAVAIGLTISKPLELRLFHGEVNNQIEINSDEWMKERAEKLGEFYEKQITPLKTEWEGIKSEQSSKEGVVQSLLNEFLRETDGTGGSRKYGYSVVAKQKQAVYLKADGELKQFIAKVEPRLREIEGNLDKIENDKKNILNEYRKTIGKGFLGKLRALSDLTDRFSAISWANLFIIFLLIMIEITPVLVKILSPFGPYDAKLDLKNEADIQEAVYRKDYVVNVAQNHYGNMTDAEIEVDKEFFTASTNVRKNKLLEALLQWQQPTPGGQGLTAEKFYESIKNRFFFDRKP